MECCCEKPNTHDEQFLFYLKSSSFRKRSIKNLCRSFLWIVCVYVLYVQSVKSTIHQYFHFFREELSISRFQTYLGQVIKKDLLSIFTLTNIYIPLVYICKNRFFNSLAVVFILWKFCEMATTAKKPLFFSKK